MKRKMFLILAAAFVVLIVLCQVAKADPEAVPVPIALADPDPYPGKKEKIKKGISKFAGYKKKRHRNVRIKLWNLLKIFI